MPRVKLDDESLEVRPPKKTINEKRKELLDDLQANLKIDKNDLDNELIKQPTHYYRVAKEFANAVARRDAAKLELSREAARLDREIRQEARDAKEKITETEVLKLVQEHEDYGWAMQGFQDAEKEVNLLQALKEAFTQRSYVLKDLVGLWTQGYYGAGEHGTKLDRKHESNRGELAQERRRRNQEE